VLGAALPAAPLLAAGNVDGACDAGVVPAAVGVAAAVAGAAPAPAAAVGCAVTGSCGA
jgi:hypothetical protein